MKQEYKTRFRSVFSYAAGCENYFENYFKSIGSSYKRISTFYSDLSIAEWCDGAAGVKDTYNRVCKDWIGNYKMFTEFVMSLNMKSWQWAPPFNGEPKQFVDEELCELYSELYYKAKDLAYEKFTKEQKDYLFDMTD